MPDWLKHREHVPVASESGFQQMKSSLRDLKLTTVCEQAKCPNIGECWGAKGGAPSTATIMLLGEKCTRACR